MVFSLTWNTAYEASPANTDDIANDAEVARNLKIAVRERLEIDHSWTGDANDGQHKKATLIKQGSDPTEATDRLIIYTKTNSDKLYGVEPGGTVLQITPPVGSIFDWPLSTEPNGYIFADGRTLGETGAGADHEGERFRELFDLIKVEGFGNAGTEDFDTGGIVKLPDLRDRVSIGSPSMGSTDASRIGSVPITTLSANELSGATVLDVVETDGIYPNDIIEITLDSGSSDSRTVSSVDRVNSTVTIATGLSGAAALGNIIKKDPDLSTTGGEDFHTLIASEIPTHNHGGSTGGNKAAGLQALEASGGDGLDGGFRPGSNSNSLDWSGGNIRDITNHSHSISSFGGGGSHNNLQPFLVLNKIIKY